MLRYPVVEQIASNRAKVVIPVKEHLNRDYLRLGLLREPCHQLIALTDVHHQRPVRYGSCEIQEVDKKAAANVTESPRLLLSGWTAE
jgi:hypothetical protein